MKKDKLVSVIIPLYNHGLYVIETLESIYDSDYTELELLILDDGSNDNGFDLATDWLSDHSSRFVRVWSEKQNNSGINATTNKLVNNSKGYYIYLIASDDRVPCNAINKLVFAHEKAFKGKEGLLFYDVTTINENSEIIEKQVSRYLVKDFGTSKSQNRLANATTYCAPAALRPCHFATPSQARRWLRSTPSNGWTAC